MDASIQKAIQAGLDFLATQQRKDGGFASDSSPSPTAWQAKYNYQTSFVPSLILSCLAKIPQASKLRQNLSKFVLVQKSPGWSFNYWARTSSARRKFPYPDDLDDTFCALIGLHRHDPTIVDEKALVQIINLLIASETTAGGPYRTWLTADPEWQDIDIAVNTNIARFLALSGSPSPPLLSYLEAKIKAADYASDYYPTNFPVWYYLAPVCPAHYKSKLKQAIVAAPETNSLQQALALSALCQLKAAPASLAKQLLDGQNPDGSWPAAAFCLDPSRKGKKHYHGAAALTTAFAIEALQAYQKPATNHQQPANTQATDLQQHIVKRAGFDLSLLAPDLRRSANTMLQKVLAADQDHKITLLPYYFSRSLVTPIATRPFFYQRLGLANLYGWLAYTIYDDFIDEEAAPGLLSVANWAMRLSLDNFRQALPHDHAFQTRVGQTFTVIDEANAWEVAHCRSLTKLPDYGKRPKLAERSLGHTLTPQAILRQAGYGLESRMVIALQQSMHHYLIARQLDDDAHDWQADLKKGHISYVVGQLLQDDPQQAQQTFWHHTLPAVCTTMQDHLHLARIELAQCTALRPDNYVAQLLDGVEMSVKNTLNKQAQAARFLKAYRSSVTK